MAYTAPTGCYIDPAELAKQDILIDQVYSRAGSAGPNADMLTGALNAMILSTKRVVGTKGLYPSQIPVDVNGYTTSLCLKEYCLRVAAERLFKSLHREPNDIYDVKSRIAYYDRVEAENGLSSDTILGPTLPDGGPVDTRGTGGFMLVL